MKNRIGHLFDNEKNILSSLNKGKSNLSLGPLEDMQKNEHICNALDEGLPEGVHFHLENAFEFKEALTEEFINIISSEDCIYDEIYKLKKLRNSIARKVADRCTKQKDKYIESSQYEIDSRKYQEVKVSLSEIDKQMDQIVDDKINFITKLSATNKNHMVYYNNFHKKFYAISKKDIKVVGNYNIDENPMIFGPCNDFYCQLCRGEFNAS